MNQNINNLTALFKESIAQFCSLQEALYYILLGIIPCGDNETFQQNINNALMLKHNFPNNPYLQDSNINTNSGTIKSGILDNIITEYDKYCIELEKLCQNASNDLRELLFKGTIKTYHAESKNFVASSEEKLMKEMLFSSRNLDAITGKTLTKMERTNFDVFFEEKKILTSKASAGEQKKMLFSVFISAVKIATFHIILIDEIASKLDNKGKDLVFSQFSCVSSQIFATGAEDIEIKECNYINI